MKEILQLLENYYDGLIDYVNTKENYTPKAYMQFEIDSANKLVEDLGKLDKNNSVDQKYLCKIINYYNQVIIPSKQDNLDNFDFFVKPGNPHKKRVETEFEKQPLLQIIESFKNKMTDEEILKDSIDSTNTRLDNNLEKNCPEEKLKTTLSYPVYNPDILKNKKSFEIC